MSVGAGGGLLAAVRSGRVCRLCSLWAAGSSARRALLLWPLVCTGGNGSGGVRPGAGGGADLLAVPVGMVSAGTVPAVGVPASRLALAVLHPVRFCRLPEGSDSPLYRVVL